MYVILYNQSTQTMTHTYTITGMTCSNCEAKVKAALLQIPAITGVTLSKETNSATIDMEKHVALPDLQQALDPKYRITMASGNDTFEQTKSWFGTYKPILMLFAYILFLSLFAALKQGPFNWMLWMPLFMAGFFLTFSFFKLLNLEGFVDSYSMYDIVAKKFRVWGYVYAFIELGLGISYLLNFQPLLTNLITFVVMSISIIGVLQSVLHKRKIQCACLGAVFNLPMSTVTIIEDVLMIGMSAVMVVKMM
jgi:copper chaperone CopZ